MTDSRNFLKVNTLFEEITVNTQDWNKPFNQIAFINTGPSTVLVNNLPVPTNRQLVINLNVGELNMSTYAIDFDGAAERHLWLVYTKYDGINKVQL